MYVASYGPWRCILFSSGMPIWVRAAGDAFYWPLDRYYFEHRKVPGNPYRRYVEWWERNAWEPR